MPGTNQKGGVVARIYQRTSETTLFVLIGLAVMAVGLFIVRDLHRTKLETQRLYVGSVGGLSKVDEITFEAQEARRRILFALSTADRKFQVRDVDQSELADTSVSALIQQHLGDETSGKAWEQARRVQDAWAAYLKTRDQENVLMLAGNSDQAAELELRQGVPQFEQVRKELQDDKNLYLKQATDQLAAANASANRTLLRLGIILCLAILFALLSARQMRKSKILEAVAQSEERLRLVIESINEGMFVVRRDGMVQLWNRMMERYSGKTREEAVGKSLLDALPSLNGSELLDRVHETFVRERAETIEIGLSDNSGRLFNARLFPFESGATVFFSDVTEKKKAEEALFHERHLFHTLMDSVPDPIYFKDTEGRFTRVNSAQANLLGINHPKEVIGKTCLDFFREDYSQLVATQEEQIMQSGQHLEGLEEQLTWPNGQETWHSSSKIPLHNLLGQTVGTFGILHDITKTKRAEEELRAALQMKSDFVSFATHQLRTPLAGIKWLLELAVQEEGISEEPAALVRDARESAQRLINMVNELLDVSRLESGKLNIIPQAADLMDLTQTVLKDLNLLVQNQAHRVQVDGLETKPLVMADPQLLRQVIMNLVSNAIKYTPAGGKIAIRMSEKNGWVEWSVKDSGIGIPKASQSRLFEKFFRAENVQKLETEGTGLGLCLVRLILERSGGRLWFESEENKGSTFFFSLPSHTASRALSESAAARNEHVLGKLV